ncbi:MAG TPA: mandelate racemase, partial [Planctomycetaceae bacterium]|nr:mandelate racemase [Planctomycetaceae bacterium]
MTQPTNRRDLLKLGAGAVAGGLAAISPTAVQAEADDRAKWPDLKITKVTSYLLECELERAFGASVSVPLDKTRDALLVKIETDSGLVGWGETSPISGARGTIDKFLAPRLIGNNPLEYRKLWRSLWGPNFGNGLATGAVEMAINDIRGKALGMPVAELFGGRFRDKVPVYVSALDYVEGIDIEKWYPMRAEKMVKAGHKAIKMRLGRYSVAREVKVIKSIRKAAGPDVKLMADGNGAYTMGNALKMAHHLRDFGFEFLEEPMPQRSNNYPGYDRLR